VKVGWRVLCDEFYNSYWDPTVTKESELREICITHGNKKSIRILICISEGSRLLLRLGVSGKTVFKINFKKVGFEAMQLFTLYRVKVQ
jgi:hypothetical protein